MPRFGNVYMSSINLPDLNSVYSDIIDRQDRDQRRRIRLTEEILDNPKYKGRELSAWRMFRELTNKYKEQLNIIQEEQSFINVDVDYIKIIQKQVECSWDEAKTKLTNISLETSNSFRKVGEDLYIFTFTTEQLKEFFDVIEAFPEVLEVVRNNTTFYLRLMDRFDFDFVEAIRKYPINLSVEREE